MQFCSYVKPNKGKNNFSREKKRRKEKRRLYSLFSGISIPERKGERTRKEIKRKEKKEDVIL